MAGVGSISLFLLAGCAGPDSPYGMASSPGGLGAVLRGEAGAEDYLRSVEQRNLETRESAELARNAPTERAFNTRTGRVEFVPADTEQRWNPERRRWEFTPRAE